MEMYKNIVNYSNMIFYNLLCNNNSFYLNFKTDKTNVFKVKHANVALSYYLISGGTSSK